MQPTPGQGGALRASAGRASGGVAGRPLSDRSLPAGRAPCRHPRSQPWGPQGTCTLPHSLTPRRSLPPGLTTTSRTLRHDAPLYPPAPGERGDNAPLLEHRLQAVGAQGRRQRHQPCAPTKHPLKCWPGGTGASEHPDICPDPPGSSWAQEQTTWAALTNPRLGALLGGEHVQGAPRGRPPRISRATAARASEPCQSGHGEPFRKQLKVCFFTKKHFPVKQLRQAQRST